MGEDTVPAESLAFARLVVRRLNQLAEVPSEIMQAVQRAAADVWTVVMETPESADGGLHPSYGYEEFGEARCYLDAEDVLLGTR